jgi:hypothetical protein
MNAPSRNVAVVEDQKLCVLYDPSNGAIVHTHWVTTLPGGRVVGQAEMEKRIRERAAFRGRDVQEMKVLHVDPKDYEQGTRYQVDTKAGKLTKRSK